MSRPIKNKTNWIYVTLTLFALFIAVLFISISYQQRIRLSMPVYFFLLTICALAATAFLSGALKSSAEYNGTVMKGNLRITGAVVIFLLIIGAGYRFRPKDERTPFDLTILVRDVVNRPDRPLTGTIQVVLDNDVRKEVIDAKGKVVFANINADYAGKQILVSADIEGFRVSGSKDTMVMIPDGPLPVIHLPLTEINDSTLFAGYLMRSDPGKIGGVIDGANILFNEFDRTVQTDSTGRFRIYLSAREGATTPVTVFRGNKMIFSGRISLSRTMQIITHE
ncbi:MAG: hypothetical protein DI535_08100 [Citrobacter freundii]|nr:MAG: hypothetical protein DI535_08100 [Citrobacter freundii]